MLRPRYPSLFIAIAVLMTAAARLCGGDGSAAVQALEVFPPKVNLAGSDATQQLVITSKLADGRLCDATSEAVYEVADPKVAA